MENSTQSHPFFIVGCPRSGTTLLQLLINSHPNIAIPPESHVFVRFSNVLENYGELREEPNLRLLINDLLEDYRIKVWGLNISADDFNNKLKEVSFRNVVALLFELYAEKESKIRWGDKTPQHCLYARDIKRLFPEAKFIHLVRDGRDVAVSSSRIFVGPPSIYGIANEWKRYVDTFETLKKSLRRDEYLEVQYENLVCNPESELERIFTFLEEKPIYTNIGKDIPNSTAKKHYLQTDAHMQSLNFPISNQKIGLFKDIFTSHDIEIFETIAGDMLTKYGYQIITNAKAKITNKEKALFFMKDKFYRYYRKYFRIRETEKIWFIFKREAQPHLRSFKRYIRKKALLCKICTGKSAT